MVVVLASLSHAPVLRGYGSEIIINYLQKLNPQTFIIIQHTLKISTKYSTKKLIINILIDV